jgi:hypothetical protein
MQTTLYFHESDIYPYRPTHPIWMIFYMSLSFLFFLITNRTTKSMATIHDRNNPKDKWLRQNTLLSFIHSLICSMLLIIAALRAPEMFDDPLSHSNLFNYAVIAFSIGYFLWDFFECLRNSTSSIPGILMHHIVVITFLSHTLIRTRNIGYALYARRLLRWYSPISSSIHFKKYLKMFIDIGNYITFIIFRFGVVIIALRVLYMRPDRLEPIIQLFTVLSVCTIGILNVVLFYRLLKNQISRKTKTKQKKVNEDDILITDDNVILPS